MLVKQPVNKLISEVGHAQLVMVRIDKGDRKFVLPFFLDTAGFLVKISATVGFTRGLMRVSAPKLT